MQDRIDWRVAWQPMIEAVGCEFGAGQPEQWGEVIEESAVRRYVEPLEIDCGTGVPFTALASFALPLLWRAGDPPLFADAGRDAQPRVSNVAGLLTGLEPPTTHFFAVESDADFFQSALVGERLCRRGALLLTCTPKQTRVGRGAFICWQSEIINENRDVLARLRTTFFRYNPTGASA